VAGGVLIAARGGRHDGAPDSSAVGLGDIGDDAVAKRGDFQRAGLGVGHALVLEPNPCEVCAQRRG